MSCVCCITELHISVINTYHIFPIRGNFAELVGLLKNLREIHSMRERKCSDHFLCFKATLSCNIM